MKKIFFSLLFLISVSACAQIKICALPQTTTGTREDYIVKEDSACGSLPGTGTRKMKVKDFLSVYGGGGSGVSGMHKNWVPYGVNDTTLTADSALYYDPMKEEFVISHTDGSNVDFLRNRVEFNLDSIRWPNGITYLDTMMIIMDSQGYFHAVGKALLFPSGGGGGTPAGNDKWVQYNDGGSFGADTNFYWDKVNKDLSAGIDDFGSVNNHVIKISNGSSYSFIGAQGGFYAFGINNPNFFAGGNYNTTAGELTLGSGSSTLKLNDAYGALFNETIRGQHNLLLGSVSTGNNGEIQLIGETSGTITIKPQHAAGTYNFNLPTTAGTAGQVLTSQGGGSSAMSWTTPGSGTVTSLATGLGLSGGTITTSGTIIVDSTVVAMKTAAQTLTNKIMSGSANTFVNIGNSSLTNSSFTLNGSSVSLGGTRTLSLASSDFANQGTTTTLLHGNASGNPSFGQVVAADISSGVVDSSKVGSTSIEKIVGVGSVTVGTSGHTAFISSSGGGAMTQLQLADSLAHTNIDSLRLKVPLSESRSINTDTLKSLLGTITIPDHVTVLNTITTEGNYSNGAGLNWDANSMYYWSNTIPDNAFYIGTDGEWYLGDIGGDLGAPVIRADPTNHTIGISATGGMATGATNDPLGTGQGLGVDITNKIFYTGDWNIVFSGYYTAFDYANGIYAINAPSLIVNGNNIPTNYKEYSVLLTQSGTGPPTVKALNDTSDFSTSVGGITFYRNGTPGEYSAQRGDGSNFDVNKTYVFIGSPNDGGGTSTHNGVLAKAWARNGNPDIKITTDQDAISLGALVFSGVDGWLTNTAFTIRIYQ